MLKEQMSEANENCDFDDKIQNSQIYKDEPWYSNLCQLLEKGYYTTESMHIYQIMEACRKLKFTAGYRNFFDWHYIVSCNEMDWCLLKRQDCLLHFLHITEAELSEYSENHQRNAPKAGFLKEWAAAAFRYERVKQMLDEIYHYHRDFDENMKVYAGTLSGWSCDVTKTDPPRTYVEYVHFDVMFTNSSNSGLEDKVILNITDDVATNWLMNGYYDEERHRRYDIGKSTEIRAYVDTINYIRKLEWVEK